MKTTLRVLSGIALAATLMVLTAGNAKAEDRDDHRYQWGDRDDHRSYYRHYEYPHEHRSYWNFGFVYGGNPPPVYYRPPPPPPVVVYQTPPPAVSFTWQLWK
jgi:hypothetical protein